MRAAASACGRQTDLARVDVRGMRRSLPNEYRWTTTAQLDV
jgi:hypothetical protein